VSASQNTFAIRGALAGATLLFLYAAWTITRIALAYDGTCGGLIPFLSGPRDCSFAEYSRGRLALYFGLVPAYYWPLTVAAFVLGPTLLGLIIDRARRPKTGDGN
jgi:hypothetical protein